VKWFAVALAAMYVDGDGDLRTAVRSVAIKRANLPRAQAEATRLLFEEFPKPHYSSHTCSVVEVPRR
jgi:hypothetical protein